VGALPAVESPLEGSQTRDWCNGSTVAFQAISRGSSPLSRSTPPPPHCTERGGGSFSNGGWEAAVATLPVAACGRSVLPSHESRRHQNGDQMVVTSWCGETSLGSSSSDHRSVPNPAPDARGPMLTIPVPLRVFSSTRSVQANQDCHRKIPRPAFSIDQAERAGPGPTRVKLAVRTARHAGVHLCHVSLH
jgi:hypothetical protein